MRYAYLSMLGFALGITFRSYVDLGWNFSLFVFSFSIAFGLISIANRQPHPNPPLTRGGTKGEVVPFAFCFLLFASIGMLRFDYADATAPRGLDPYIGQHVSVTGLVRDEPLEKGQNMRMILDVDGVTTRDVGLPFGGSPTSTRPTRARILANIPPYPAYQYGDRILLSGDLDAPSNFSPNFDWVNYLKKDDIRYEMQKPQLTLVAHGQGNPVVAAALRVRHAYLAALQAIVPEPESALGAGITVGENGNVIAGLQETFRRVGLSHVIVVSGYNLTIVGNNFAKMLAVFPRTFALGGGALAVIFFVLLTGGGASVMRAAVMALIAILARSTGRLYEALWALLLAGTIMLLINPRLLVFDLSFQLSFLATLGLIFLSPTTGRWQIVRRLPNWEWAPLREHATATCAALLAVAPIILTKMGNFSFVAIPANLLVLSFVPYSMFFTAATGGLGIVSRIIAFPFAIVAYVLLWVMVEIAKLFAALPFASVEGVSFPWWLAVLCYAGLIYIVYRDQKRKEEPKNVPEQKVSNLGDDFEIEELC